MEYDASQAGADVSYGERKWLLGNTRHAYQNQGCGEGELELVDQINTDPNNRISTLVGFWVDLMPIEMEISQTKAVVAEYSQALIYGSKGADWEAYYDEFMTKLEAAGVQSAIDEIQSQVDAFIN